MTSDAHLLTRPFGGHAKPALGYVAAATRQALEGNLTVRAVSEAAAAINREVTHDPERPIIPSVRIERCGVYGTLRHEPVGIALQYPATRLLAWQAFDRRGRLLGAGSAGSDTTRPRLTWNLGLQNVQCEYVDVLYVGGRGTLSLRQGDITVDSDAAIEDPRVYEKALAAFLKAAASFEPVPGESYSHWAAGPNGAWAIGYNLTIQSFDPETRAVEAASEVWRFGDWPAGPQTMGVHLSLPDPALSTAAKAIAKRWQAISDSPGRGVVRDELNPAPPTPALLYGLTTQLRQFRPFSYGLYRG